MARNRGLGRYTQFANLLDLAAVAVPAGHDGRRAPVGVTLIGPAFAEDRADLPPRTTLIRGGR